MAYKRREEAIGEYKTTKKVEKAIVKKDSKTLPLIISSLFGTGDIAPPTSMREFIDLYKSMVWVYSAVFAIASSAVRIPLKLYSRKKDGREEIFDHPIVNLLYNPNPSMSWKDLLEATLIYMELGGEEFWEVVYNKLQLPQELWPLRPSRITINTTRDRKRISSYTFKIGSYKMKFDPKFIFHFKNFAPSDDWHGQSSIQAAVESIITEQYAMSFNKRFFKQGATPTGVLEADRVPSRMELKRLRADWERRFVGEAGAYRTPILPRGMRYNPISPSSRDMEFAMLRRFNREEILSAFGVPPVKVGLLEYAKYASYELQETAFYRDTVVPKLQKVEGILNLRLVPLYGDKSLFLEFDIDKFIQGDIDKLNMRYQKQIVHGIRTPNEVRAKLGLKPYEDGNKFYMTKQLAEVGSDLLSDERPTAKRISTKDKIRTQPTKRKTPFRKRFRNEHSARLRSPKDFDKDSFRRTKGGKLWGHLVPQTVSIIWGKLIGKAKPSDPPLAQAIRFPTKNWTVVTAKKWLKKNNIKFIKFESALKKE